MIRALALCLVAGSAAAQPVLRPDDEARLAAYHETVGVALMEAFHGGTDANIRTVVTALSGAPEPLDPEGEWACRTIKLGKTLPIVAYSPFRCRITEVSPGVWTFEKLTGSQRTAGTIWDTGPVAYYAGVGYVNDDGPIPYGDFPPDETVTSSPQRTPDVAVFEQVSGDRARLIFPAPHLESRLDILELTR